MKNINIELFLEEEQDLNINIVIRKGKVELNTLPSSTEIIDKLPAQKKEEVLDNIVEEKSKTKPKPRASKKEKEVTPVEEKKKNPGNFMDMDF